LTFALRDPIGVRPSADIQVAARGYRSDMNTIHRHPRLWLLVALAIAAIVVIVLLTSGGGGGGGGGGY
jgi:hypothetical protein